MLRTASSLPLAGLLTLGFDPTRFQMKPPACYRATWQLPEPDSHRQATTSLRTANHLQRQPPAPLDARKIEARAFGCVHSDQAGRLAFAVVVRPDGVPVSDRGHTDSEGGGELGSAHPDTSAGGM